MDYDDYTPEEIVNLLKEWTPKHVVITGGEPLLQMEELYDFWIKLKKKFSCYVEVETNGTLMPSQKIEETIDYWSVSPKKEKVVPEVLKMFKIHDNSIFKFVIDTTEDVDWVNGLVKELELPTNRVWLMPQGITTDEVIDKSPYVIDICKVEGYRYSPRLQVMIWGDRRKV